MHVLTPDPPIPTPTLEERLAALGPLMADLEAVADECDAILDRVLAYREREGVVDAL